MNIILKEEKISEILPTIFNLDEKIFTEKYHRRSSTMDELSGHLKDCKVYMAYDQKKPIGYISYRQKDNDIELMDLAVIPEYQNKGIGTLLMNTLLENIKRQNITLATHPFNSQAIRFYLKFGFKIAKWKDNYFGNNQPRLILIKEKVNIDSVKQVLTL